ncbi:Transcription factor iws1 [Marasmius crinis-equi]|uniref:Transcription factor iws1 n=1 Tax=Marasmius crinis-equi TaxID=585013 RepID=A0ABR3FUK2_9AGAR
MPDNDKLARDIFGGSDSELSSDEERAEPSRSREDSTRPRGPRSLTPSDEEQSGDDDYVERDAAGPGAGRAVKKKGKKKSVRIAEDGERREKKRKRAAKKDPYQDIDLSELPPEQASKIRLNQKIEAALKSGRSRPSASRSKRKKNDEQILDSFADDEVARLRESMNAAAEEDIRIRGEQSAGDKVPAMAKLKMLNEVVEVLRKGSHVQSIIDNNLLDAVKRWLEPLPDRSLPALNIQRELFALLKKMEFIDSSVLKESGLGPLVLFYTKCKRVQPDVRRIAEDLVSTWSRPIVKRSASYRDRVIPTAIASMDIDDGPGGSQLGASQKLGLNAIMARAKEEEKNRVRKNTVAIPQRNLGTYTTAPKANAGLVRGNNHSVDEDVQRRRKNAERLRMLTRKVKTGTS